MDSRQSIGIRDALQGNSYPGRGIIAGCSPDGTSAVIAYFIMGRSANSRNRILAEAGDILRTQPYDAAKVEDPSLIIYTAVRRFKDHIIVSNGDQTDTIYDGLSEGTGFYKSLESRSFEPDAPNYTPRISADLHIPGMTQRTDTPAKTSSAADGFSYSLSILKSADADGSECIRCGFDYKSIPGAAHFIHTYARDGNPLPSFEGEPVCIDVPGSIDDFADEIWEALDMENRISLYVRYTDIRNGDFISRLINKNTTK